MLFVGVDLAWSDKNNTAITIIEGNKEQGKIIKTLSGVWSDKQIIKNIEKEVKDSKAFISIDAPLKVPNENGNRVAEKLTNSLFRKYEAGAHPANRSHLKEYGGLRGEEIVKLLEEKGFQHKPEINPKTKENIVFEVFPHPATVVLFDLRKTLKYKPRANRDYNFRWKEFQRFQKNIKNLSKEEPPLITPKLLEKDVTELKGKSLKEYEDILDSIICAYVAYYYWYWGKEKCAILGSMEEGYILTPVFDYMKKKLNQKQSKLNKYIKGR